MPVQQRKSNRSKKPTPPALPPSMPNPSSQTMDEYDGPRPSSDNNGRSRKRPVNRTSRVTDGSRGAQPPAAPTPTVVIPQDHPESTKDTTDGAQAAATSKSEAPPQTGQATSTDIIISQPPHAPLVPSTDNALVLARRVAPSREQMLAELDAEEENIKRRRQDLIRFLEATPSCSSSDSSTLATSEANSSVASTTTTIDEAGSMATVPVSTIKQIVSYLRPDTNENALPEFRGCVTQWPEFLKKFKSSTAARNLSDEENLARLQGAIQGTARAYVHEQLKEACFVEDIIERLDHRYGGHDVLDQTATRKARAVRDLDSKLTKLPHFTLEAIRIQAITRQSNDSCLAKQVLFTLKDKLPPFMVLSWGIYQREIKQTGNLDDFVRWLKRTRTEYEEVGQFRAVEYARRTQHEEAGRGRRESNLHRTRYDDRSMRPRPHPSSRRPPGQRYQPYPRPQRETERQDKKKSNRTPDRLMNIKERTKKEDDCEICAADYGNPHGARECPFKQKN